MTNVTTHPPHAAPWLPSELPSLRAAYSDRTAALMAYLAGFAYDARIEIKGALAIPNELSSLGFAALTSFHNGMTDGWAFIAEGPDLVVLSFRGTASKKNWNTNFHVRLIHPDKTDRKLLVHEGFYRAFVTLDEGTLGIADKMEIIKTNTRGNIPIYITGHSLGGALAQIAGAVIGSDQVAACYTFGSPRVGNPYFDLWVKVPSYRVMNYADIVPQVPLPIVYRHSGDPRYMPKKVTSAPYRFEPNLVMRVWQTFLGLIQLVRAGSILGIEDHAIANYCQKLDRIADARTQSR
jgi:triacylglycerol lipase